MGSLVNCGFLSLKTALHVSHNLLPICCRTPTLSCSVPGDEREMPTLRRYEDGRGYYVRQNFAGQFVTYQVNERGRRAVLRQRLDGRRRRVISQETLFDWINRDYVQTGGGGPGFAS